MKLFSCLFIFSILLFTQVSAEEDSSGKMQCYKYGTWEYYSTRPITVEDHYRHIADCIDSNLHWMFHYSSFHKPDQERFHSKLYYGYQSAQENLVEYIDPSHMPKELALRFAMLFAFKATSENDKPEPDLKLVENYFKTSLFFFSYYFGHSESSPPIIKYTEMEGIDFSTWLDEMFEKTLSTPINEAAWIKEIQQFEHKQLERTCILLRSIYQHLQNEELIYQMKSILVQVFLPLMKNPSVNLDAINPWVFRLYIDLKEYENNSFLDSLQKECLRLMPNDYTLDKVTKENESDICKLVRKRNLLQKDRIVLDQGEEIVDEFEFSPETMRGEFLGMLCFFDQRARFIKGQEFDANTYDNKTEQIYNYLSGYIEMNDIPITEENALQYLLEIKLFDLMTKVWNSQFHVEFKYLQFNFGFIGFDEFFFPRSTFELRKKILKLCPHLKTYEALTNSVNPDKVRDEKEDVTEGSWVDESEDLRQSCVVEQLANARYLAEMMEKSPLKGIVIGTRGISGAGKSTFVKRNILPLIGEAIEVLAQGILNPDIFKAALKKLQGDTLNTQIHEEASNAFKQVYNQIVNEGSFILDRRQLTPHDILSSLVEPAKKGGNLVWLFDFDISPTACIYRILARPLYGDDPCPHYEALIDGCLKIRRYRSQVIDLALSEATIDNYELYATGKQLLIANKVNGSLCIYEPEIYQECLTEQTLEEIERELTEIISDSSIDKAIEKGYILPEQRESIALWRGLTLKQAIQLHVQGGKGTFDEIFFEQPILTPFNGAEWFSDLPQMITFLQNEHLLHVKGVDKTGKGLHWEAGYFDKGLNPKYQPETNGGIQMKLGYFIVPMDNLEIYLSDNLSPSVTRELVVRDDSGNLIGLRFFVHPEAYAHFAPLLMQNIQFVPPSESEFIGSPTSSYNSWVIRRISMPDRRPFIVKMGAPNGNGDIKNLLAADDIVRSLKTQKKFDKLPENPGLVFFKETAGLILKDIPGYPTGTIDSGIVISEFPEEFLRGECSLVNLASVMSCEQHPIIFGLMETAIKKGLANTPKEFLQHYFIDAYVNAIEPIVFKEGYSLAIEPQNLYLVLNPDNTIKSFAYRDLKGMLPKKRFLESYSWYYRYTNFIKLMNVVTQSESDELPIPLGAPIRAGIEKQTQERSLYHYLSNQPEIEGLSITQQENLELLMLLDNTYLSLLKRYFAIDESLILNPDGTIPAAEKGSDAEKKLSQMNQYLWKNSKN